MERFANAISVFEHAIDRARQMVSLFDALESIRGGDPANDDALRAAYFQTVSSFDFFAHELALVEAAHRFSNALRTQNIVLPMEIMTIGDPTERLAAASNEIRQRNSFKAFVDPAKIAEMLSCYCGENPWRKICDRINSGKSEDDARDDTDIKGQLKSIWKRRNQIAHEADVNPTLAGISLWPIDKVDTIITIEFISEVGMHLPHVICEQLPEPER